MLRHHWRGYGTLLQTNLTSAQLIQDQELKLGRQDRLQPKEGPQPWRLDPIDS
jgi:hypothetical protein